MSPLCAQNRPGLGARLNYLLEITHNRLSSCTRNQGSDGGELMEITGTKHFYFYSNYTPKYSNLENGFSS